MTLRLVLLLGILSSQRVLFAQHPPGMGYMFPPGVAAGTTTDVILGGYDWTPDMQVFVLDDRIQLEILEPPGPVLVPEPPYWFGKKARRPPFLLPREAKARLTVPKDVPPGLVHWQAANANGATTRGSFVVSHDREVIEHQSDEGPQTLEKLPVGISGQVRKIEEVDRYRFSATRNGPVTCSLTSSSIGSPLNAVLEVYSDSGNLITSATDTVGRDLALTFLGEKGQTYEIRVYDLDFRGNRSFVYRLRIAEEPRVVAAFPAVGNAGTTQEVEFFGYGFSPGSIRLESRKASVTFPSAETDWLYTLKTPAGTAQPVRLFSSELPSQKSTAEFRGKPLTLPVGINGVFREGTGEHRYQVEGEKGETLTFRALAQSIGSNLDLLLTISNEDGKELKRQDDQPDSTDPVLVYRIPKDGTYHIGVSDVSGMAGHRLAMYRLEVESTKPGMSFDVPDHLDLPIGGKGKIALKVTRHAGFNEPVTFSVHGLPEGVTIPKNLVMAAGKSTFNLELAADENAAASAALIRIHADGEVEGKPVHFESEPLLLATTITPPFSIDAEGKDDVTKWPRGSIFPAPVLIDRNEGFDGEIVLEMTSKQGRHRQGITGPELVVPPDTHRILYPVTLPEWLETTRTSRMVVNGVANVRDPKGNLRYSVTRQKTRMGFLPTGALLKLSHQSQQVFQIRAGETIAVPLELSRNKQLTGTTKLELIANDATKHFQANAQTLADEIKETKFSIAALDSLPSGEEYPLTIRATVLQEGKYPVISETTVIVEASSE